MSSRFSGYSGKGSSHLSRFFFNTLKALPRSPHYQPKFQKADDEDHAHFWAGTEERHFFDSPDFCFMLDGTLISKSNQLKNEVQSFIHEITNRGTSPTLQSWSGEFSLVCTDKKRKTVYLIRDRLGVKPLYYYLNSSSDFFSFGSQPFLLFSSPGFNFSLNNKFIGLFSGSHYRTIDNDIQGSPYSQINQLEPGTVLSWSLNKGVRKQKYWEMMDHETRLDFSQATNLYREKLKSVVAKRFSSASAPVFTLSGGLDSSTVMACAVHMTGHKQIAYSSIYSDPTYDETEEIKSMLDQCVSQWNPVKIEPVDIFSFVSKLVAAHNEPVATATWLSHFVLSEKIFLDNKRTVFGGLGGDELNAGEYEYFFYFFADLKRQGNEDLLSREIQQWIHHHDHPVFKKTYEVAKKAWTILTDQKIAGKCLADRARIDRYHRAVNSDYFEINKFIPEMDEVFTSYLKNRTHHDLFRETMPCCVRAEDRHSAYFGLENSLPFLDHELVEFMFSIPGTWKIKDGVTKILLREAMTGILPDETRKRIKKMGWNAPAHIWFSRNFYQQLQDLVHSQGFINRGIYNTDYVQSLLREHKTIVESGKNTDNHMMFFWQLLNLELWLQWLDRTKNEMKGLANGS